MPASTPVIGAAKRVEPSSAEIDPRTAVPRLTLGIPQLLDGIDVVIVAVGFFAVGEVLYAASRSHLDSEIVMLRVSLWLTGPRIVSWRRSR